MDPQTYCSICIWRGSSISRSKFLRPFVGICTLYSQPLPLYFMIAADVTVSCLYITCVAFILSVCLSLEYEDDIL